MANGEGGPGASEGWVFFSEGGAAGSFPGCMTPGKDHLLLAGYVAGNIICYYHH